MADAAPGAPRGDKVGTGWPSYRYGPKGARVLCQGPEDVPTGFVDNPDKLKLEDQALPPPPIDPGIPLTRVQIIDALNIRKAPFTKNAPTAKLYDLLLATMQDLGES